MTTNTYGIQVIYGPLDLMFLWTSGEEMQALTELSLDFCCHPGPRDFLGQHRPRLCWLFISLS